MVVYFECPQCACACACTEFQVAGAIACESCGRRVRVPRLALHSAMAGGPADAGRGKDPARGRAFDCSLIPTPAPLAGRISNHIEHTLGPCPMVFHHTLAPDEALDIHVVPPKSTPARMGVSSGLHVYTLATSGLSSRRPHSRRSRAHNPLAELMISLPANWPGLRPDGMFDHQLIRLPEYAWPIEWLKIAAGMAFEHVIEPTAGTLVPEKGKSPFEAHGTHFSGMLLAPSTLHSKAATLMVHDDLAVSFLALWPLYAEELRLARRKGPEELLARFAAHGITDVISPDRRNVAR